MIEQGKEAEAVKKLLKEKKQEEMKSGNGFTNKQKNDHNCLVEFVSWTEKFWFRMLHVTHMA